MLLALLLGAGGEKVGMRGKRRGAKECVLLEKKKWVLCEGVEGSGGEWRGGDSGGVGGSGGEGRGG